MYAANFLGSESPFQCKTGVQEACYLGYGYISSSFTCSAQILGVLRLHRFSHAFRNQMNVFDTRPYGLLKSQTFKFFFVYISHGLDSHF